jgi:hypothetical protein
VLLDLAECDALRWVGHKDATQQVLALGADLERGGYRILDSQDALLQQGDKWKQRMDAGDTCARVQVSTHMSGRLRQEQWRTIGLGCRCWHTSSVGRYEAWPCRRPGDALLCCQAVHSP